LLGRQPHTHTMRRLLFQLSLITFSAVTLYAGAETYSSKNTAAAQPCPNWYAENEWNVSLWGTYAFTSNDYPTLQNSAPTFGAPNHDTYIEADHSWGGGVEGKYFFARYFGIGVEGYALDVQQSFPNAHVNFVDMLGGHNFARTSHNRQAIGSILGTFTLRYPFGCSRFAPYLFAGGGAIFGGDQTTTLLMLVDEEITSRSGSRTKAVGQFGGGLEVRLTPHIGIMNDFTWNVIDGRDNNFGMARTGIDFAF